VNFLGTRLRDNTCFCTSVCWPETEGQFGPIFAYTPYMISTRDFVFDRPGNDLESVKRSIANNLLFKVGKVPSAALPEDWLHAVAYAVRDRLVEVPAR
jgi:hypothetical protein